MSSQDSARVYNIEDFRAERAESPRIGPVVAAEAALTARRANIEDLYDSSVDTPSFAATARSRFGSLASGMNAARGKDTLERDEAIMRLQAELPRSFALDGWSDGSLAIITALNHGLRNTKGAGLSDTQYLRVLQAVTTLRDSPVLRFERSLDIIDALQTAGLVTEPEEAVLLQTAFDD